MQLPKKQTHSIFDILSYSVELYLRSFPRLIAYSLIVVTIRIIFTIMANDTLSPPDSLASAEAQMDFIGQLLPVAGYNCIIFLCENIFYAAMIYRIDNLVNQRDDDFFEVLALAFKKTPALILAAVLYLLAIIIGSVLLVVPGIIFMISLSFYLYFIVIDNNNGYTSLMASHRLVWGDWWRTNIVFFIPSLLILILFFACALIEIIYGNIQIFSLHLTAILAHLLIVFIAPYMFVLGFVQYQDLTVRKNSL